MNRRTPLKTGYYWNQLSAATQKMLTAARVQWNRLGIHKFTNPDKPISITDLSKRDFLKVGGLAAVGTLTMGAGKCGAEKVSIYVRTISTFLNQISALLPDQAAFITKIVKIAADFDAAYRRGDFATADTFFNSLEQNLTTLTNSIGTNTSNSVKTWLSIIGITVTSLAVLFKEQLDAQPESRRSVARVARSASAVERLASQAQVDAVYQAARLR